MFKWISSYLFSSKIQISHFLLHWPIRAFRFNLIREISTWKITDAIAAGYCFPACFLAEPLIKELLLFWTKLLCIYPFLFEKKISTKKNNYSIYGNLAPVFSTEGSHFLIRRNKIKPPTPVLLTIHFLTAMTTLY